MVIFRNLPEALTDGADCGEGHSLKLPIAGPPRLVKEVRLDAHLNRG